VSEGIGNQKAISGIGKLSETLMDRAAVLELRRKLPTETIERLLYAELGLFDRLASKLARLTTRIILLHGFAICFGGYPYRKGSRPHQLHQILHQSSEDPSRGSFGGSQMVQLRHVCPRLAILED